MAPGLPPYQIAKKGTPMEQLQVFDPTYQPQEQAITFSPRPDSLRNRRIGLVDNTKFNSDKLLIKIATILEQQYGATSHLLRRKRRSSIPDEEIINEFADTCDVVIAGVGD
jgi:hypothetical protein